MKKNLFFLLILIIKVFSFNLIEDEENLSKSRDFF